MIPKFPKCPIISINHQNSNGDDKLTILLNNAFLHFYPCNQIPTKIATHALSGDKSTRLQTFQVSLIFLNALKIRGVDRILREMYIFNMWEIITAISVLIIAIFWVVTAIGLLLVFKGIKKTLEALNQQVKELNTRLVPVTENLQHSSHKIKEIVEHVDETVEAVDEIFKPMKENKDYAYKGLFIGLASTIGVKALKEFISKKFFSKKEV